MKHLRVLIVAAFAVTASLAMAGSASATTITSSSGPTPTITATGDPIFVLDNPIAKIECHPHYHFTINRHPPAQPAEADEVFYAFSNCANSWHVTVVTGGSMQIHASGGGNGTITSSGATFEATRFGITCRYATSSTDIGALTAGEHATLDISAAIPFHSGSGLCGSGATSWTGSLKVQTPTNLSVDS